MVKKKQKAVKITSPEALKTAEDVSLKPKDAQKPQKMEVVTQDDTFKPFHALKTKKSRWSIKYWKTILKDRFFPERTVLVNMELLNGMHRQFLVVEKDGGFRYRKKKYIFDNESKYFVIDSKLWSFDFHEAYVLPLKRIVRTKAKPDTKPMIIDEEIGFPIKREIPISNIRKALENSNISEVEYASNPSTLERFIVARIAEGIMKGQQLDEWMKQLKLLIIIGMVAGIIHLLLFMFKTGMLQSIGSNLPF